MTGQQPLPKCLAWGWSSTRPLWAERASPTRGGTATLSILKDVWFNEFKYSAITLIRVAWAIEKVTAWKFQSFGGGFAVDWFVLVYVTRPLGHDCFMVLRGFGGVGGFGRGFRYVFPGWRGVWTKPANGSQEMWILNEGRDRSSVASSDRSLSWGRLAWIYWASASRVSWQRSASHAGAHHGPAGSDLFGV